MWGGGGEWGAAAPFSACSAFWWKNSSALSSADSWGSSHAEGQAGSRAEVVGLWGPTLWGRNLQKLLRKSKVRRQSTGWLCFPFSFLFLLKLPPRRKELGSGARFALGAGWVTRVQRAGPHLAAELTSRSWRGRRTGPQTSLLDLYFNFRKELRKHALESQEGDKSWTLLL